MTSQVRTSYCTVAFNTINIYTKLAYEEWSESISDLIMTGVESQPWKR